MEGIDGAPFEVGFIRGNPLGQEVPYLRLGGDEGVVLVWLHRDFPASTQTGASHIGHRTGGIAILDRVIAELRLVPFQDHVHDQPSFVKSEILHFRFNETTDQ